VGRDESKAGLAQFPELVPARGQQLKGALLWEFSKHLALKFTHNAIRVTLLCDPVNDDSGAGGQGAQRAWVERAAGAEAQLRPTERPARLEFLRETGSKVARRRVFTGRMVFNWTNWITR
jgi:hypothetical protein